MNIHEHQAKAVLREFGVPVPHGVPILARGAGAAAAAELPGPLYVVKAQIHAGGRGKGRFKEFEAGPQGGVRLAKSPAEVESLRRRDVRADAGDGSDRPGGKAGQPPLSRRRLENSQGILPFIAGRPRDEPRRVRRLDRRRHGHRGRRPRHAGKDRLVSRSIRRPARMPHHGRTVAKALGLEGDLAKQAGRLATQLYEVFVAKDMAMLEINPLVVTEEGRLICLDAKISFDSNALYRHPEIAALRDESEEDAKEIEASKHDLNYISLAGDIGCMVNGAGLAMATMDIIKLYGAEPANFLDVGGGATKEKVTAAFKIITADPNVKGILVNIFGGIMKCDVIAEGVIAAVKEVGLMVPLVVRLEGTNVALGQKFIAEFGLNVITADDLDDAAQKIVAAVRNA